MSLSSVKHGVTWTRVVSALWLLLPLESELDGEERWEPGGGRAVEEPALQRELKIARRDDVIGFPQLSTPSLTHIQTYSHRHRYTQTQWGHAYTHAHSHLCRGGRLLGPRAAGAGKSGECVCMLGVCLCVWVGMSLIACVYILVFECMHACVCVHL